MSDRKKTQADIPAPMRSAPMPFNVHLVPEFMEEFSRRVLGSEWRYIGTTAWSSVLDFTDATREQLVERIRLNYGQDVDDIPDLNLWEVMRRCAGK